VAKGAFVTSTATAQEPKKARISATTQIILGLVIGVITGYIVSITNPDASEAIRPFAQLFIRMIQMIIAPLLFATLVAGIAGAGHFKDVGRMGLRAIIYFEVVTTLALLIGLLAVNVMQPGVGLTLPPPTGPPPITARPQ
jgi:proton glutamate symport protein